MVARIHIRSEDRLMFPSQEACDLCGQASKRATCGIYHIPDALCLHIFFACKIGSMLPHILFSVLFTRIFTLLSSVTLSLTIANMQQEKPLCRGCRPCQSPIACSQKAGHLLPRAFSPAYLYKRAHNGAHHTTQKGIRF